MICLEDLVPKNHILRAIDAAIDFNFIYDEVEGMYSKAENGRPGIDPVSLFKIVMIQYIFGIRSMRQTIKEIELVLCQDNGHIKPLFFSKISKMHKLVAIYSTVCLTTSL